MMTMEEEIDFNRQMVGKTIAQQKKRFHQSEYALDAFENHPIALAAHDLVLKCGLAVQEFLYRGGRKDQAILFLRKLMES
ncbi:hypothetical protein [Methylocella sp.]|uniref:hypothetical protein n=1 Tax=Methylocella sp. TaxID=1978226 RepID=UPI0035B05B1A